MKHWRDQLPSKTSSSGVIIVLEQGENKDLGVNQEALDLMVTGYWKEVAEKVRNFMKNLNKRTMKLPARKRRIKSWQKQQITSNVRCVADIIERLKGEPLGDSEPPIVRNLILRNLVRILK